VAFLLGAEDRGLPEAWLKRAQARVRIPMRGRADSLNVAVSAALLLYEALRQRSLHDPPQPP
jgi:TrmH family RNA methyltransferase